MFVRCGQCSTEFELDPEKVPAEGVRARCSVCSAVIAVPRREGVAHAPRPERAAVPEPAPILRASELVAQAAPSAIPVGPAAGTSANEADSGSVPRRSINPFLTKDPSLRAKRLARALVSDIVVYYPAKHAEGLRDGSLKQLFRDEIKKSYEEYVDQVGRPFAESTTYFQEALNDVLAAGKKLF